MKAAVAKMQKIADANDPSLADLKFQALKLNPHS
jgi:hypothetical protein